MTYAIASEVRYFEHVSLAEQQLTIQMPAFPITESRGRRIEGSYYYESFERIGHTGDTTIDFPGLPFTVAHFLAESTGLPFDARLFAFATFYAKQTDSHIIALRDEARTTSYAHGIALFSHLKIEGEVYIRPLILGRDLLAQFDLVARLIREYCTLVDARKLIFFTNGYQDLQIVGRLGTEIEVPETLVNLVPIPIINYFLEETDVQNLLANPDQLFTKRNEQLLLPRIGLDNTGIRLLTLQL